MKIYYLNQVKKEASATCSICNQAHAEHFFKGKGLCAECLRLIRHGYLQGYYTKPHLASPQE